MNNIIDDINIINSKNNNDEFRKVDHEKVSVAEAAEVLGVSVDTLRNWVKLGKIEAASKEPLMFEKEYLALFNKEIERSGRLSSRRNKSRKSGSFVPKYYVSSKSPNFKVICEILEEVDQKQADIDELICFYAADLLRKQSVPESVIDKLLGCSFSGCEGKISGRHLLSYIPGEDTLGLLYLSLRKMQDKKSSGSYYTPFFVVDRLIADLADKVDFGRSRILDPACGTGNFLLRLPDEVPIKNVYGYDIDPMAVKIARINVALRYGIDGCDELKVIEQNVRVNDFLKSDKVHFDVILGNPPWGFSYTKNESFILKTQFECCKKNRTCESFDLFIEKSLDSTGESRIISFLLPETLLEADIHSEMRRIILKKADILSLHYLGDVFDNVQCPSAILTMVTKSSSSSFDKKTDVSFARRSHDSLVTKAFFTSHSPALSAESFHILADDYEQRLLDRIKKTPHFTLAGNAVFALGIVTGDNKNLLKASVAEGLEPIVKGKDIEKFRIRKPESYIHYDPDSFQQCARTDIYRSDSKLLYRFISDRPIVAQVRGGILALNSANILIPDVPGYSHEYITALLNSSVLGFYYLKSYRSLKVLRSSLESLPIAQCDHRIMTEITSDVRELERFSDSYMGEKSADTYCSRYEELLKALDLRIARLYGLDDAEFACIMSKI